MPDSTFVISVELPLAPVQEAASKALQGLLIGPRQYNGRGNEGFEIIRLKISEHIEKMDILPLIEAEIESAVSIVIEEVLNDAISSVVKKRVDELKRDGTLGVVVGKLLPTLALPDSSGSEA